MPDPAPLDEVILAALVPDGVRDGLRMWRSGGRTIAEILDRLPAPVREGLQAGAAVPAVARRQALDRVRVALDALAAAGKVRHLRRELTVDTRGHGVRRGIVDRYARI